MVNEFYKILKNLIEIETFLSNEFLVKSSLILSYFNQHTFNILYSNEEFRKIFQDIHFYQEGIGCYLGFKTLGFNNVKRIDSTYINGIIFIRLIELRKKFFLIGYNFSDEFLKEKVYFSFNEIVGYQNGYFEESEINRIAEEIRKSGAEFVLIGMGQPKQEFVAVKLKTLIPNVNYFCVGNFFNFYFGIQKRAPKWIRKLQLEWLFRFLLEPGRMFNRYIIGIPLFFYRLMKLKFKF
ncbi:MAG: WecB/TagA/CpsF family glycosyltransferase [Ignavibacteria bacterium]